MTIPDASQDTGRVWVPPDRTGQKGAAKSDPKVSNLNTPNLPTTATPILQAHRIQQKQTTTTEGETSHVKEVKETLKGLRASHEDLQAVGISQEKHSFPHLATPMSVRHISLNDCLNQPGSQWDKQQTLLQKNDDRSQFAKDQPRQMIKVNGEIPSDRKRDTVRSAISSTLEGYPPELQLQPQIEYLLTQTSLSIDNTCYTAFMERYITEGKWPVGVSEVPVDDAKPEEQPFRETVFEYRKEGNLLQVSAVKYYRVQETGKPSNEPFFGYTATRFEVTIDLTKVKMPKGIRTDGCAEVRMQEFGFRTSLEDLASEVGTEMHLREALLTDRAETRVTNRAIESLKSGKRSTTVELDDLLKQKVGLQKRTNLASLKDGMPGLDESVEILQDRDPAMFVNDWQRNSVRVNGRVYPAGQKGGLDEIHAHIGRELSSRLGTKPGFDEKKRELVRWQLERLCNQTMFMLDQAAQERFDQQYSKKGLQFPQDARDSMPELDRASRAAGDFTFRFEGNKAVLSSMRYFAIQSLDGKLVGYDSRSVSISIDLDKMNSTELVFSPKCAKVTYSTSGLRPHLSDLIK